LTILTSGGLYARTKKIIVFICMFNDTNKNYLLKLFKFFDEDNKITLITTRDNLYEKFAINNYKKYINDSSKFYVYYFHTKGVTRKINSPFARTRKNLNYYTLVKHQLNTNLLNYYDAVGCSLSKYPCIHFSGNFWWAKSDYIAKLSEPIRNTYLSPEMYICSVVGGKFISLSQTSNDSFLVDHINVPDDDICKKLTSECIDNINCKNMVY